MAKGIFGNSKFALGFAGITVAFAAIAAMSVNLFVPSAQQSAPQDVVVEIDADQGAGTPAATQRAPQTWADEGSFPDDWSRASTASRSSTSAWGGRSTSGKPEVEFEDFEIERPGPQKQPGGRARSAQSSNNDRVTIISRAAPGAPPVIPPN